MKKSNLIEIKAQTEVLYTLRILTNNTDDLIRSVADLVDSSKNKFKREPVILEIEDKQFQVNELAVLVEILTQKNIVVVGIRSRKQELMDFAKFSGLAVFGKSLTLNEPKKPAKKPIKKPAKKPQEKETTNPHQDRVYRAPKIVTGKVSSSAQVVAKNGDLVLLDRVKAEAEILAHGSVAAYKEVQGKVFAGIDGDEKATIFIHAFNAQLISIAGIYKKFDTVPTKLQARAVMIDLNQSKLRFQIV